MSKKKLRRKTRFEMLEDRRLLAVLSIADITVTEDIGTFGATISLSEPETSSVTFTVATSGGSATGGLDYRIAFNDGVIDAGQTSTTVDFVILQDSRIEPLESFFLNISSPRNATIADGIAEVFIVDDDGIEVDIEFRSIDGSGNNPIETNQGIANSQVIRFGYPAGYPDRDPSVPGDEGIGDEIAPTDAPNPRDISNQLMAQSESILNDRNLSDWVVHWGQFITHEMAHVDADPSHNVRSDGTTGDYSIPINDPSDPLGPNPIPFNRSAFDPQTGNGQPHPEHGLSINPRQQMNGVTSFIDGSIVYGSDKTRADALRTFEGGKLKTTANGQLPGLNTDNLTVQNTTPVPNTQLFLAGDIRANENVGLLAIQTLFVREHNRLADAIQQRHPSFTDEQIYQWSRRIVGAEIQKITYEEFLPAVMGRPEGEKAPPDPAAYEYDPQVRVAITNSFTTAFFRFGHSMQSSEMLMVDDDGTVQDSLSLRESFFNISLVKDDPTNIDLALKGLGSQVAQENDIQFVDELRNFLFGPPGAGGTDLGSLDIQRGRDHGLIPFNELRLFYGLSALQVPGGDAHPFSELTSDPELQTKLAAIYDDLDDIEAIVGALAEDRVPGSSVGSMIRASMLEQFTRLRDGDRFFYTGDEALQSAIVTGVIDFESVSLAELIKNNTVINNLQDNVFFVPAPDPPPDPPTPDPPTGSRIALATAQPINGVKDGGHLINVNYVDNIGLVDVSAIDADDIEVIAPDGTKLETGLISHSSADNASVWGSYRVVPIGGSWEHDDNGVYSIRVVSQEVSNTAGEFFPAIEVGTLQVNIPESGQTINIGTSRITERNGNPHRVFVDYFDPVDGVNSSTISIFNLEMITPQGQRLSPGGFLIDLEVGFADDLPLHVSYDFLPPSGNWDTEDNGTYSIWLKPNQVQDGRGNYLPGAGKIGELIVDIDPSDTVPPVIAASMGDIRQPGLIIREFSVTFIDDVAVDVSRIRSADIHVRVPDGTRLPTAVESISAVNDTDVVVTRHSFIAPGESWGAEDNGEYQIWVGNNQISDTSGNFTGETNIGSFQVSIPVQDLTPPTAILTAGDITQAGVFSHELTVTYTDDVALRAADIGNRDLVIKNSGRTLDSVFVSKSSNTNGKVISATYRVTPPYGGWDRADNGEYIVEVRNRQIFDTSGKFMPGTELGRFRVNITDNESLFEPEQVIVEDNATDVELHPVDLDGDGDMDYLAANRDFDVLEWFENDGREHFTKHIVTAGIESVSKISAIDLDGDGDIDVLSGNPGGQIAWHENDGSQNFTMHILGSDGSAYSLTSPTAVLPADFDGDGDIDIVVGGAAKRELSLLVNDGNETFARRVLKTYRFPGGPWNVKIVDFDQNGTMDITVSSTEIDGDPTVFLNNGQAEFTTHTPAPMLPHDHEVADFDGNGDNNFVLAHGNGGPITWFQDDGVVWDHWLISSNFTDAREIELADFDLDGDIDVLAKNAGSNPHLTWIENLGNNQFEEHRLVNNGVRFFYVVDLDSDGDQDILFRNEDHLDQKTSWFENRTPSRPADTTPPNVDAVMLDVTLAGSYSNEFTVSFTDDIGLDATQISSAELVVRGPNAITLPTTFVSHSPNSNATNVVSHFSFRAPGGSWDFEDNGVYAIWLGGNQVADTAGNFVDESMIGTFRVNVPPQDLTPPSATATIGNITQAGDFPHAFTVTYRDDVGIRTADIDDSDISVVGVAGVFDAKLVSKSSILDAKTITATYQVENARGEWTGADNGDYAVHVKNQQIFDTSGKSIPFSQIGNFTVAIPIGDDAVFEFPEFLVGGNTGQALQPVDLDGDSDIDIVAANPDQNWIEWFENDGNQRFTHHIVRAGIEAASVVHAVDLDGDGDMDVLSGNTMGHIAWHENDGSQNFTMEVLSVNHGLPTAVESGDLDNDGDIDLVVGSETGRELSLLLNDGNEVFTRRVVQSYQGPERPESLDLVDVNQDGSLDIVAASSFRIGNPLWFQNNGLAQFTARATTFAQPRDIEVADIDGDGDNDFVLAHPVPGHVSWIESQAPGIVDDANDSFVWASNDEVIGVESADFDLDGDLDFVAIESGPQPHDQQVVWIENLGGNQFEPHRLGNIPSSQVHLVDLDGDGDVDIVVPFGGIRWFENRSATDEPDPIERLPGDATGDRVVDFVDFLILSSNFGKAEDAVWEDGDYDGDGVVAFTDFLILSQNFGQS